MWRRGLQDGVKQTAEQQKGPLAGPQEPGFCYRVAQNGSNIFKLSMKHNFEKAAFPPSDVTRQEKGCLFPLMSSHFKKHGRWMF